MDATTRGYRRNTDGTLDIVTLTIVDGAACDAAGYPLERTDETVELLGWPDGAGRVYLTDGGVEIIVAE